MAHTDEDNLVASVLAAYDYDRKACAAPVTIDTIGDRRKIERYTRRMHRLSRAGKIKPEDSDEHIAGALSSGIITAIFWTIAPELLRWIIAAVRRRIWPTNQ